MDQRIINILLCDTFPGLLPESIPSHEYLFEKRFHSVNPNIILKVFRTLDGELPEGAVPLATSDFCRYEGFRIGRHILTFQGHPEFTVDYERHLILNHAENEDDAVKQRALETLETMQPQGDDVAEFLLDSVRKL